MGRLNFLRRRTVASVLCLTLGAGAAHAFDSCSVPQSSLSENDVSRLENLDTSRARGLGAAMRSDNAEERAVVAELYEPGVPYVDDTLLAGKYDCRTIKMGGISALVVYDWFRCDINANGENFTVQKVTGSQNFLGVLEPAGSGYAYHGARTYGYEDTALAYGDDPERDQVGCLSAVTKGNKHFMLELPFPKRESFHDVIEFRPVR